MPLKTFIRWPGNKSKKLKYIKDHIPTFNTYIEPFIGSGALFLYIEPQKWIINDINSDLIAFWKIVKKEPENVINTYEKFSQKFQKLGWSKKLEFCKKLTDELAYHNKKNLCMLSSILSHCSYTGNILKNDGTYQFLGLNTNISNNYYPYFSERYYTNLNNVSSFLNESHGQIYNVDFQDILIKAKEGDFVFLDPPYKENHDYSFKYNLNQNVDIGFLKNICKWLEILTTKGVFCMLSQPDTELVNHTFEKFVIFKYPVYRGFRNSNEYELLIMNY